jgi:hypothetical protein
MFLLSRTTSSFCDLALIASHNTSPQLTFLTHTHCLTVLISLFSLLFLAQLAGVKQGRGWPRARHSTCAQAPLAKKRSLRSHRHAPQQHQQARPARAAAVRRGVVLLLQRLAVGPRRLGGLALGPSHALWLCRRPTTFLRSVVVVAVATAATACRGAVHLDELALRLASSPRGPSDALQWLCPNLAISPLSAAAAVVVAAVQGVPPSAGAKDLRF